MSERPIRRQAPPNAKLLDALGYLEKRERFLVRATPRSLREGILSFERVLAFAALEFKRAPELLECSHDSIVEALSTALSFGLIPGLSRGQCYLIKYKDKHSNQARCQFQLGYRGIMLLCYRSDHFLGGRARIVRHGETFALRYGSQARITHVGDPDAVPGKGTMRGVYIVANFRGGIGDFEYMSRAEVEHVRDTHAKSRKFWDPHFDEMAKKTVVRRASKMWPAMDELQTAFAAEDAGGEDAATEVPGQVMDATSETLAARLAQQAQKFSGPQGGQDDDAATDDPETPA